MDNRTIDFQSDSVKVTDMRGQAMYLTYCVLYVKSCLI